MAWNPSPKVASAREIAKRFGFDQVVIIGISNRAGTMESISYGETKGMCSHAKGLADKAYAAIYKAMEERANQSVQPTANSRRA